jgi:flagellar hook-associated protein FlgK
MDKNTIREWQRIQQAERETGVTGKSSVDATYAAALRQMGMDTAGLSGHANAAKAVYQTLRNRPRARAAMAMDAGAVTRRSEMFPNANRLSKSFY